MIRREESAAATAPLLRVLASPSDDHAWLRALVREEYAVSYPDLLAEYFQTMDGAGVVG